MRFLALIALAGLLAMGPARPIPRREFRPAAGDGRVASFSATGDLVALSGGAAPVAVFQTRTGLLLRTYTGHAAPVTDLAFAPHPDTVLSADSKGQVHLWHAETLAPLGRWQAPAPLVAVAFAPGGGQALLASGTACWLWNLRAPGAPASLKLTLPARATITAVAFGTEGQQVALGLSSGAALVYQLGTATQVQKALATTAVRSLALRADTLLAAASSPDLLIWPVRAGATVTSVRLPQALTALAAGPDRNLLALGFATGETMLWNRRTNHADYEAAGPAAARRVQLQPGGALLLSVYEAGGAKTWLLPE